LRWSPKKSVLHQTIAAIRAATWEAINQALLASAKQDRLENGATVRLNSTVTAALMHQPSDSALLSDAVRVMTWLLQRGEALPGTPVVQWRDRRRLAKKRARTIEYSRGQDKKRQLYRELIAATEASRDELQAMAAGLAAAAEIATERWHAEVAHYPRALLSRPDAACLTTRSCRSVRSWSACSSRTPTSSSKAVVRFSTDTSST
jgi:IS5 family transposase